MLIEESLFGTVDKVKVAINRLKLHEPPEGYYVAFSGGKDSVVVYWLCKMAEVKFDSHYAVTTVDPPDHVQFIKREYPDAWEGRVVRRDKDGKRITMWSLIEKNHYPPLRKMRYCCRELKEQGGLGRFVITGVRRLESARRRHRPITEQCRTGKGTRYLHPIVDWSEAEVWEFIRKYNVPYSPLYDRGRKRVGCLMCPFAPTESRLQDAREYPKVYQAYVRVFDKIFSRLRKPKKEWHTGEDYLRWWLTVDNQFKEDDNAISLFGLGLYEDEV